MSPIKDAHMRIRVTSKALGICKRI